ncbi:hypothetical protein SAMN05443637_112168 [Pseudonocardia thermophila]|jgi:hypothetical protein|uniref:Uncharacterized protein n=1 Tax=Pseudonocardia thermophila TaxID=1848 RepID=A0A1M6VKB4_PSETH|nr:hypothetical protein [Pseudonocardia thermophila]SHK81666.1 hypothetical protein SAMN05443637_112168 [Pseudonocardia thermophila]
MGLYEGDDRGIVDASAARAHADAAGITVDRNNVLYVRRAVLEEYQELTTVLERERMDWRQQSEPYGRDPVSFDAAVAFPQRAALLLEACQKYADELLVIADNLAKAAEAYGYTEDSIVEMTPTATRAAVARMSATLRDLLPW